MFRMDKFFLKKFVAVGFFAAALIIPVPGGSEKHEIGDLMSRMEVAYTEVVKVVMISSVQDLDDLPFNQASGWAKEITKIADLLPRLKDFKNNNSVLNFSRQLKRHSIDIEKLSKKERWDGMVATLNRLQNTCIGCHKKHRF